jgi:hypothetical protein
MCTFLATPPLFFQTGNCLLCTGREHPALGGASTFIPIARTSIFISAFVRFFDRSFQPHLDQVE